MSAPLWVPSSKPLKNIARKHCGNFHQSNTWHESSRRGFQRMKIFLRAHKQMLARFFWLSFCPTLVTFLGWRERGKKKRETENGSAGPRDKVGEGREQYIFPRDLKQDMEMRQIQSFAKWIPNQFSNFGKVFLKSDDTFPFSSPAWVTKPLLYNGHSWAFQMMFFF